MLSESISTSKCRLHVFAPVPSVTSCHSVLKRRRQNWRHENLRIFTKPAGSSSHLRAMLPKSSSRPLHAQRPNHTTKPLNDSKSRYRLSFSQSVYDLKHGVSWKLLSHSKWQFACLSTPLRPIPSRRLLSYLMEASARKSISHGSVHFGLVFVFFSLASK